MALNGHANPSAAADVPCPSAAALDGYLTGRAEPACRTQIEVHIARCAACRQVVASLARIGDHPPRRWRLHDP